MQRSVPQAKEVQEILLYYINDMYIGYWLLHAEFLSTVLCNKKPSLFLMIIKFVLCALPMPC